MVAKRWPTQYDRPPTHQPEDRLQQRYETDGQTCDRMANLEKTGLLL